MVVPHKLWHNSCSISLLSCYAVFNAQIAIWFIAFFLSYSHFTTNTWQSAIFRQEDTSTGMSHFFVIPFFRFKLNRNQNLLYQSTPYLRQAQIFRYPKFILGPRQLQHQQLKWKLRRRRTGNVTFQYSKCWLDYQALFRKGEHRPNTRGKWA